MKVRIPTPLRSYTANCAEVDATGATLAELLDDLDRQFPGIRFRMVDEQGRLRTHMNIFVEGLRCRDLSTGITDLDEVVIMQALSGG
ncbi:MAG TPA: MoaD/ThiS family protein [Acidimicrobiales bacterium]